MLYLQLLCRQSRVFVYVHLVNVALAQPPPLSFALSFSFSLSPSHILELLFSVSCPCCKMLTVASEHRSYS